MLHPATLVRLGRQASSKTACQRSRFSLISQTNQSEMDATQEWFIQSGLETGQIFWFIAI
jgi:hypothetical protein